MGASVEVQKALYTKLRTTAALTLLLAANQFTTGSAVYDFPPQSNEPEDDSKFPYVSIGETTEIEFDTDDVIGREGTVTLHSWSRQPSALEVKGIMDLIKATLHSQPLTVAGESMIFGFIEMAEVMQDPDGRTLHGVQRYRIVTQGS